MYFYLSFLKLIISLLCFEMLFQINCPYLLIVQDQFLNTIIYYIQTKSQFPKMYRGAQLEIRKRIEESGQCTEIDQLCLDGIQILSISNKIRSLIQSCTRLEYFTMNDCELTSLENFPKLPNLITLELINNKLSGDDLQKISTSTHLTFLSLVNNQISSVSCLKKLTQLKELQMLQIHENQISNEEGYRRAIFQILPNLRAIDCEDQQGNFVQQESDEDDYITNKEPSASDFNVFLECKSEKQEGLKKDQWNGSQQNLQQILQLERSTSQAKLKRKNVASFNLFSKPNSFSESDSQQEMGGQMMREFKKKFRKI